MDGVTINRQLGPIEIWQFSKWTGNPIVNGRNK